MKTINQHISLIEEWLQVYKVNDDFDIPREVILSFMNTARSALLREDIGMLNSNLFQRGYLDIKEEDSSHKIENYNIHFKGYPYVELPNLVSGLGGKEISYLGTIDFEKANYLSIDGFISLKDSQWSKGDFSFTVIDNIAYFQNLPDCKIKTLMGMFMYDNPMDATDDWDTVYPCHSDHRLFVLTTQLISSAYAVKGEDFNNARHDTEGISVQQQRQQQQGGE